MEPPGMWKTATRRGLNWLENEVLKLKWLSSEGLERKNLSILVVVNVLINNINFGLNVQVSSDYNGGSPGWWNWRLWDVRHSRTIMWRTCQDMCPGLRCLWSICSCWVECWVWWRSLISVEVRLTWYRDFLINPEGGSVKVTSCVRWWHFSAYCVASMCECGCIGRMLVSVFRWSSLVIARHPVTIGSAVFCARCMCVHLV